jgi:multiple sugar transport system permease protein
MAQRKRGWVGYAFIGPATLHLLVFALFPLLYTLYMSLFRWNLLRDEQQFIGLENYRYSLADPLFWNAMWNSTKYTVVSVPLGVAVALLVALSVSKPLRGVTIFRTIYYVPAISSGVAIAMLWIYVYLPETGLLNSLFAVWNEIVGRVGLERLSVATTTDFLKEPALALYALVFMSIWIGLGPRMVLFLAGIMGIPPSLYEAAELDGASKMRTFVSVTLPMLAPTTLFVVVTSTIASFQLFTPVYMMTQGGPGDSTDVIGYHIYNEAWTKFLVGIAASKSFLLFIGILVIAAMQFRLMRGQIKSYAAP